jgi:hypothetical protein
LCRQGRPRRAWARGTRRILSGIASALADLGYPKILPAHWQEQIDRRQLEDLSSITGRYQLAPSPAPGVNSVKAVVRQLGLERTRLPKTWWERFKDWARSWFESSNDRDLSWIDRWLDRLQSARGIFSLATFGFVAVVLVGAVVFVIKELRSGGVLKSKQTGQRRFAAHAPPADHVGDGFERAPLLEQPALLLAALVQRLKLEGRLAAERHLTHRELPRAVRLNAPEQRDRLSVLAAVAETVLYGAQPPAPDQVESALVGGRKLLLELGDVGAVR